MSDHSVGSLQIDAAALYKESWQSILQILSAEMPDTICSPVGACDAGPEALPSRADEMLLRALIPFGAFAVNPWLHRVVAATSPGNAMQQAETLSLLAAALQWCPSSRDIVETYVKGLHPPLTECLTHAAITAGTTTRQPATENSSDVFAMYNQVLCAAARYLRSAGPRSLSSWQWWPVWSLASNEHNDNSLRRAALICCGCLAGLTLSKLEQIAGSKLHFLRTLDLSYSASCESGLSLGAPRRLQWAPRSLGYYEALSQEHSSLHIREGQASTWRRQSAPAIIFTRAMISLLDECCVGLHSGIAICISGPSGSGKTAAINHLSNMFGQSDMAIIHADDQMDGKSLLGSYLTTEKPGQFQWFDGCLSLAAKSGKWILFEDIDKAPADVLATLASVLEQKVLLLPGDKPSIQLSQGFRLLCTISCGKQNSSQQANLDAKELQVTTSSFSSASQVFASSNQQEKPLVKALKTHCHVIVTDELSSDDLASILAKQSPRVFRSGLLPGMISAFYQISRHQGQTTDKNERMIGTRDLFKAVRRAENILKQSAIEAEGDVLPHLPDRLRHSVLTEMIDICCSALLDSHARASLAKDIASCLGVFQDTSSFLQDDVSGISQAGNGRIQVQVGRAVLKIHDSSRSHPPTSCLTSVYSKTLASVAMACSMNEPMLLVGEAGTGKTQIVQDLAAICGTELHVFNLNNQSDSMDLIGGWQPVHLDAEFKKVCRDFAELFEGSFGNRNAEFMQSFQRKIDMKQWSEVLQMMKYGVQIARDVQDRLSSSASKKKSKKKREAVGRWDKWLSIAEEVSALEVRSQKHRDSISFAFVDGLLIRCLREGHWILLDEINLAPSETLERLISLLDSPEGSLTLTEKGGMQRVPRHPDFRLFACMNPPTDVGKKGLPEQLRQRFTESFVPDLRDVHEIQKLVQSYLGAAFDDSLLFSIVQFYTQMRSAAESGQLHDSAGLPVHFNLRVLVRALKVIRSAMHKGYHAARAVSEGLVMAFGTQFGSSGDSIMQSHIFKSGLITFFKHHAGALNKPPPVQEDLEILFEGFALPLGQHFSEDLKAKAEKEFILTKSVSRNVSSIARAISIEPFPVLLQGPTSAGKTSAIYFLAALSGHRVVRINNHAHTDVQEYTGGYASDSEGSFRFIKGPLVNALEDGDWVILDELNLAPSEVLEMLNRLLDDNRELLIAETQEVIRPKPSFRLFATQNPSGSYGGRKVLSRAFRSRFLELHVDSIPGNELVEMLIKKAGVAPKRADLMVKAMSEMRRMRKADNLFGGSDSIVTARDMFRWASRIQDCEDSSHMSIATEGFLLLAESSRQTADKQMVAWALKQVFGVDPQPEASELLASGEIERMVSDVCQSTGLQLQRIIHDEMSGADLASGVVDLVANQSMNRILLLIGRCVKHVESALLVGPTGTGKTSVCQYLANRCGVKLSIINCHQNSESADLLGAYRPVRGRAKILMNASRALQRCVSSLSAEQVASIDIPEWSQVSISAQKQLDLFQCLQHFEQLDREAVSEFESMKPQLRALFEWYDGVLVQAMRNGDWVLLDEISLADDSVLERMNSIFESERSITLTEKAGEIVQAHPHFRVFATMNPGGDFGKKELSPALRNRFTEIWVDGTLAPGDVSRIVFARLNGLDVSLATLASQWIEQFFIWYNIEAKKSGFRLASIRDCVGWATFILSTCARTLKPIGLASAVLHGAEMVFLDCHDVQYESHAKNFQQRCSAYLLDIMQKQGYVVKPSEEGEGGSAPEGHWGSPEFSVKIGSLARSKSSYCMTSSVTSVNVHKVLRAMQVPKAILLEGSPGVGKSSLIASIAKETGHRLVRINLSDSTDIVDLLGTDMPSNSTSSSGAAFEWCDGILLKAVKAGDWVLLDELNLAPQPVLEGLNALLDHRQQIFIPEINRTVNCPSSFRIFATQNPLKQGGGRKGLPASFLNRFSHVYVQELSKEDMKLIVSNVFDQFEQQMISQLVEFVHEIQSMLSSPLPGMFVGGPWELNLRDLFRVCQSLSSFNSIPLSTVLYTLFVARFRSTEDRKRVGQIVFKYFEISWEKLESSTFSIGLDSSRIGAIELPTPSLHWPLSLGSILSHQIPLVEACLLGIKNKWPILLVGAAGVGKSTIARQTAALCQQKLLEISVTPDTDTSDLVGAFEQRDENWVSNTLIPCIQDILREVQCVLAALWAEDSQRFNHLIRLSATLEKQCEQLIAFSKTETDYSIMHGHVSNLIANIHNAMQNQVLINLQPYSSSHEHTLQCGRRITKQCSDIEQRSKNYLETSAHAGAFEWIDGRLVSAMKNGQWVLLDRVNLCLANVLDRLNAVLEFDGSLLINERGLQSGGEPYSIEPHPDFRIFMTANTEHGEVSRAMRNRSLEICIPIPNRQLKQNRCLGFRKIMEHHGAINSFDQSAILASCMGASLFTDDDQQAESNDINGIGNDELLSVPITDACNAASSIGRIAFSGNTLRKLNQTGSEDLPTLFDPSFKRLLEHPAESYLNLRQTILRCCNDWFIMRRDKGLGHEVAMAVYTLFFEGADDAHSRFQQLLPMFVKSDHLASVNAALLSDIGSPKIIGSSPPPLEVGSTSELSIWFAAALKWQAEKFADIECWISRPDYSGGAGHSSQSWLLGKSLQAVADSIIPTILNGQFASIVPLAQCAVVASSILYMSICLKSEHLDLQCLYFSWYCLVASLDGSADPASSEHAISLITSVVPDRQIFLHLNRLSSALPVQQLRPSPFWSIIDRPKPCLQFPPSMEDNLSLLLSFTQPDWSIVGTPAVSMQPMWAVSKSKASAAFEGFLFPLAVSVAAELPGFMQACSKLLASVNLGQATATVHEAIDHAVALVRKSLERFSVPSHDLSSLHTAPFPVLPADAAYRFRMWALQDRRSLAKELYLLSCSALSSPISFNISNTKDVADWMAEAAVFGRSPSDLAAYESMLKSPASFNSPANIQRRLVAWHVRSWQGPISCGHILESSAIFPYSFQPASRRVWEGSSQGILSIAELDINQSCANLLQQTYNPSLGDRQASLKIVQSTVDWLKLSAHKQSIIGDLVDVGQALLHEALLTCHKAFIEGACDEKLSVEDCASALSAFLSRGSFHKGDYISPTIGTERLCIAVLIAAHTEFQLYGNCDRQISQHAARALVLTGCARALLSFPMMPCDPALWVNMKFDKQTWDVEQMRAAFDVSKVLHQNFTGVVDQHAMNKVKETLHEQEQLLNSLQTQRVSRGDPELFMQLHQEVKQLFEAVLQPEKLVSVLGMKYDESTAVIKENTSATGSDDNSAVANEHALRNISGGAGVTVQRLSQSFAGYEDLTVPIAAGLVLVKEGLVLLLEQFEETNSKPLKFCSESTQNFYNRFVLSQRNSSPPGFISNISAGNPLEAKRLVLQELSRTTDLMSSPECCQLISLAVGLWSRGDLERCSLEAEEAAGFVLKVRAPDIKTDEDAERQLRQQSFPDFSDDYKVIDPEDVRADEAAAPVEEQIDAGKWWFTLDEEAQLASSLVSLCRHIHASIVTSDLSGFSLSRDEWLHQTMKLTIAEGEGISGLPCNVQAKATWLAAFESLKLDLQTPVRKLEEEASAGSNIWKEANPAEAALVFGPTNELCTRTLEIMDMYPDTPQLEVVLTVARRLLSTSLRAPLGKLLTGTEVLLKAIDEWEMFAATHVTLRSFRDSLARLVVRWRRLEVRCWPIIIQGIERDAYKQALSAMPKVLAMLLKCGGNNSENSTEHMEIICSIKAFILAGTMADFTARIECIAAAALLYQFMCSGQCSEAGAVCSEVELAQSVASIAAYYSQFCAGVRDQYATQKASIEKQLKDLLHIGKWDTTAWSMLKDTMDKSHRQVHRLCSKVLIEARQPAKPVLINLEQRFRQDLGHAKLQCAVLSVDSSISNLCGIDDKKENVFAQTLIKNQQSASQSKTRVHKGKSKRSKQKQDQQDQQDEKSTMEACNGSAGPPNQLVGAELCSLLHEFVEELSETSHELKESEASKPIKAKALHGFLDAAGELGLSHLVKDVGGNGEAFLNKLVENTRCSNPSMDFMAQCEGTHENALLNNAHSRLIRGLLSLRVMYEAAPTAPSEVPARHADMMGIKTMHLARICVDQREALRKSCINARACRILSGLADAENRQVSLPSLTSISKSVDILHGIKRRIEAFSLLGDAPESDSFIQTRINLRRMCDSTVHFLRQAQACPLVQREQQASALASLEECRQLLAAGIEAACSLKSMQRLLSVSDMLWSDDLHNFKMDVDLLYSEISSWPHSSFDSVLLPELSGPVNMALDKMELVSSISAMEDMSISQGIVDTLQNLHELSLQQVLMLPADKIASFANIWKSCVHLHSASTRMLVTVGGAGAFILSQGFCLKEAAEGNEEGQEGVEGEAGTGIGEGQGQKDVSDEMENEGQVEGLKGEEEQEQKPDREDGEDKPDGIEMEMDFEGELEDVDKGSDDENNDEEEDPEVDREMGDNDDGDEDVARHETGVDSEGEGEDDPTEDKRDQGKGDEDTADMTAKEEGEEHQDKQQNQEDEQSGDLEEEDLGDVDDNPEDQNKEEMMDEKEGFGPQDVGDEVDDVELPDDMQLEGEEDGDGEDDGNNEESGEDDSGGEEALEEAAADDSKVPEQQQEEGEDEADNVDVEGMESDGEREHDQGEDDKKPEAIGGLNASAAAAEAEAETADDGVGANSNQEEQQSDAKEKEEELKDKKTEQTATEQQQQQQQSSGAQDSAGSQQDSQGIKQHGSDSVFDKQQQSSNELNERSNNLREMVEKLFENVQVHSDEDKSQEDGKQDDTLNGVEDTDQVKEAEIVDDDAKADGAAMAGGQDAAPTSEDANQDVESDDDAQEMSADAMENDEETEQAGKKNKEQDPSADNDSASKNKRDNPSADKGEAGNNDAMDSEPDPSTDRHDEDLLREDHIQRMEFSQSRSNTDPEMQIVSSNFDLKGPAKVKQLTDGSNFAQGLAGWPKLIASMQVESSSLSEALRIVLEPTLANRLRGDYKTGKRLNMKKIIPFIASQYRKDHIWLRRTVPQKRTYQMLVCIDDSSSMASHGADTKACQVIAMLWSTFQRLEVGQVGVAAFDSKCCMLHPIGSPLTDAAGQSVVSGLQFRSQEYGQSNSDFANLMKFASEELDSARSIQTGSADTPQLILIVSDGRVFGDQKQRLQVLVQHCLQKGQVPLFVILDQCKEEVGPSGHPRDSVMSLKQMAFIDGKPQTSRYIDSFPFPYYLIVRNLDELPRALSDGLREWFVRSSSA